MNTGRELAYEHIRIVVPLTMAIWRASDPTIGARAVAQDLPNAVEQLNTRLSLALSEADSYYDEELVALLRSTNSVKNLLNAWRPLFVETQRLFESRHGVERTKALLVGMI